MIITVMYGTGSNIIKDFIEPARDLYLERIARLKNKFMKDFFEHGIESAYADAVENFIELRCNGNIFRECRRLMDSERSRCFFKIIAMNHTLNIIGENVSGIDYNEMEKALFFSYDFNEKEKKIFRLLKCCVKNYNQEFPGLFAFTLAKYLFPIKCCGYFSLAFIENFCYNSYKEFVASFTRYQTIKRRLELVHEEVS